MKKILRSIRHMFMEQNSKAVMVSMLMSANQNI
jgi:hypothetical protein